MLKKSALLLLAVTLVFGLGSCKFIKEKFSKKKEIVKVDSLDADLSESAYSDLSSDTGLMANTFDTTANVTATESASSVSVTSTDNSKDAVTSSNSQETSKSSSKSSNAKVGNTVSNDNQSKSISAKEKKTVADVDNASKGKRRISTSIYDGINDQAERMIIRKAEGYNDYYYVDDYDGSNAEYEKHYKLASKIDGSKDYVIPASGSSSSIAKPVAKNKPQPSFEPQKVAEVAKPEPKKVSESHIGDIPRKAATTQPAGSEKPNSANDIIKKK